MNSISIGISNELGVFESKLAASPFGPLIAVVAGGIGTILVILIVARNGAVENANPGEGASPPTP